MSELNIADRVPCTRAEGPGARYAIWVQGCPLRCPGCCNPEMLEFKPAAKLTVDELLEDIRTTTGIEGVTYLGGEPFSQAAPLAELSRLVRESGLSVMIFSGFTIDQLKTAGRQDWSALLAETDLLVDGPYLEERAVTNRRWIGSANQEVHYLTDRYRDLRDSELGWDSGTNTIEIRYANGEIQVNGFPHREIQLEFERSKPQP